MFAKYEPLLLLRYEYSSAADPVNAMATQQLKQSATHPKTTTLT